LHGNVAKEKACHLRQAFIRIRKKENPRIVILSPDKKIINKKVPKYLEHIERFSIFAPSKVRF
jgi:hypothetical protein